MKKRYFAFAGLAAITGLGIWGHFLLQADIDACNAGNTETCKSLAKTHWENKQVRSSITANGAVFFEEAAKYEKQAAPKPKPPTKWQPSKYNVSMLALACENNVKPQLKDPNSFRRLKEGMSELTDDKVTVYVTYTATNSFGGRVQDTQTCTYSR